MLSQADRQIAKEIIKEFFEKTTVSAEIDFLAKEDGSLIVGVKTEDGRFLIGENGEILGDIRLLLKMALFKKISGPFVLELDINDYRKEKEERLRQLAKSAADEAALIKKEKILPIMTAAERRIIHLEIAGRQDVVSESVGEEPQRQIVIKPAPEFGKTF